MPHPAKPSSGHPARVAALALAVLGAAASSLLVLGHWTRLPLPGCAGDSPCARAAESPWASLPLLGWPVAALALAYFLGWLGLGLSGPARRSPTVLWTARAAAAASLLYLAVALRLGLLCPYCLISHAAALGLWLLAETGRRTTPTTPTTRRQLAAALTLAGAALAATAILSPLAAARLARLAAEEQARTAAALRQPAPAPASPLTGRYRLGPADAPVQLVVFTGYQCPDCRQLENQLAPFLAANPDVALTVRHFPFCTDCNRLAKQTMHSNACWAARAAETAGLLRGPDGFWAMHRWLFARSGGFTDAELNEHLADENFDAPTFLALMQSEQTLALVTSDVEVAAGLALNRTPTLFINNVELKLWNAPGALAAALTAAREGMSVGPTAPDTTPTAPLTGPDRLLAEWREQPVKQVPLDLNPHTLGPADAPVQVLVFGDYQDDGTVKLDERLRAIAAADPRVRYAYRHFPADQKCNPTVPRSFHPLACKLARTAETAAAVGGEDAFWKVHAFILAKHQAFTDADLRAFCEDNGLGAGAILKGRDDKPIVDSLADDVAAGQAAGVTELPWLIVNGRRVPRWTLDGGDILERVIDEAAKR